LEGAVGEIASQQLSAADRLSLLAHAVPLAPRGGETFALALLRQVPEVLDRAGTEHPDQREELLERALFLAAHYDCRELAQDLFGRLSRELEARKGLPLYELAEAVARDCLPNLRRLGLRDEVYAFLSRTAGLIEKSRKGGEEGALVALLGLARSWAVYGEFERSRPVLDEARKLLLAPKQEMKPQPLCKLAQAYVAAAGAGPAEDALARVEELFQRLDKVPNSFTTASHFSLLHLTVIEDAVLALAGDGGGVGEETRRWLDEDEYVVRRRIHRDMGEALKGV
jgi:hypothetical protein